MINLSTVVKGPPSWNPHYIPRWCTDEHRALIQKSFECLVTDDESLIYVKMKNGKHYYINKLHGISKLPTDWRKL